MRALRPVRGALGSKTDGSAALEEDVEEPPPLVVLLPLVCGLASLTLHSVSPLMMPREAARLKASQRDWSSVLD